MKATLLSCTPDMTSPLFRRHVRAIKKYTRDIEHIVIDNNRNPGFNHAREINRAIRIARAKYLVLLDDDLIVTKNWLDALVECADRTNAAVVGGIHRFDNGVINHAGAYITPHGNASHYTQPLKKEMTSIYVCSAVYLINLEIIRKHGLFFDENYQKYYQESDFCIALWEKGEKTVCTPKCDVFHLVGKAFNKRKDCFERITTDRSYFIQKWIETKRFEKVLADNDSAIDLGSEREFKKFYEIREKYRQASEAHSVSGFKQVYREAPKVICRFNGENFEAGAAFHLGQIYFNAGKISEAETWLKTCLEHDKKHKMAAKILRKIRKESI